MTNREGPGSRRTPLIRPVPTIVDETGTVWPDTSRDTSSMALPHECRGCRTVYDGGLVDVTARYADCSVWKAPCCGATHDDRHAWSGGPGERNGYVDLRERERVLRDRATRHLLVRFLVEIHIDQ